jgi:acetyl esterase/lipase
MGILVAVLLSWIAKRTIGEEAYWFLVATVGGALLPPRGIFTAGAAPFVMLLCTLTLLAVAVYAERATLRAAVPFAVAETLAYAVLTVAAKWPSLPLLKDNMYHLAQPWWRRSTGYVHRRLAGVSVEMFRALREAGAVPSFAAMMEAAELAVEELTLERSPAHGGNLAVHLIAPRAESSSARPLIVYIHGGGMVLSSAQDPGFGHLMTKPRSALCDACVVASVSYRLAPEHRFPAAADDVFEALQWLLNPARAAEHGYSTTNVSLMGISAGGNLAAGLAVRAAKAGIALQAQLLIIPMLKYGATTVSCRLCTVTLYANLAHSLTRSP